MILGPDGVEIAPAAKPVDPLKWRTLYGWEPTLAMMPGSPLDAYGNPTQLCLIRKWTHNPGDIVESHNGARYMVRPDHSLRKMA